MNKIQNFTQSMNHVTWSQGYKFKAHVEGRDYLKQSFKIKINKIYMYTL